jgi:hypothetical protein
MRLIRAVMLLSTWVLLGCHGSARPPPDTRVHLLLTDAPLDDAGVTRVLVTFTRVDVYSEATGAWEQVIDYGPSGRTFDLLTLRGGITEELGAFHLPPGTYDQIRLELNANNQIEVNEGAGPELLPLTVPSGEQTGIKLVRSFTVDGRGPTEIVVDFDAEKSVQRVGHGWQVQPVVHIVSTTTSDTATRVIGPTGGTVRLLNEAQVDIPPGALTEDVEISIKTAGLPAAKASEQGVMPSSLVELGPAGTVFAVPVQVTVWFDPAELRGRPVSTMAFMSRDRGAGWVRQSGTWDAQRGTATGTMDHFGLGATTRVTAPNCPATDPGAYAATGADISTAIWPTMPSPRDPGPTEPLTVVYKDSGQGLVLGAQTTWTSTNASLRVTNDHGCTCLSSGDARCSLAEHCYDTSSDCINDERVAMVSPDVNPGGTIQIRPAASSLSKDLVVALYGVKVRVTKFFVQDDSDDWPSGDGELTWRIKVNGSVLHERNDPEDHGTGTDVSVNKTSPLIKLYYQQSLVLDAHFWEDDSDSLNGGTDEAWFVHSYGWSSAGRQLPNTNTNANNGRGSLDIHMDAYLDRALQ